MIIKDVEISLIRISKIEDVLEKFGNKFIDKVFHPEELKSFSVSHLGGRFAAKCVVKKIIKEVMWKDVKIISLGNKPIVKLSSRAKNIASKEGINSISISISHDGDRAIAIGIGYSF